MSEGSGDEGEKSHEPSQKRLDDARKRGEVAQSADLTTAAGYLGLALAAAALGLPGLLAAGDVLSGLLAQATPLSRALFTGPSGPLTGGLLGAMIAAIWPFFAMPAAVAALAILGQGGPVFAAQKLAPKLSRISLLATAKQKFGASGIVDFLKSVLKMLIYGTILGMVLVRQLPDILTSARLQAGQASALLFQLALDLILVVVAVALVFGVLDMLLQVLRHRKRNMMTRKEVIDEHKESEGDPMLKGQRRQRGVSIAMNQMLAEVPKASVVIVNPTHYAVALQWDMAGGRAPVCVAKGTDDIAARIRAIAAEHAIPIQSDPPTARALYAAVALGQEIRPEHYRAVAAAIRFAERIRAKAARR